MRTKRTLLTGIFLIVLCGIWIFSTAKSPSSHPSLTLAPTHTVLGSQAANPNAPCHESNGLPDPTCTPGSIDTTVTQENIQQSICQSGYTKTVRPPVTYTQNLKVQQIAQYGYVDTNTQDYEEDHLISLELGGSPKDPKNLWPEPGGSPNPKDKIENMCHQKVCNGQITLFEAQKEIATDWKTACQ